MAEVIPRWEWRTWGEDLALDIDLKDYEHTRHVESSEVYVLSTECDENTKARENEMGIKSLQLVNDDKLEQWNSVKKAAFPLPREELIELYKVFNISSPEFEKDSFTFDEFIDLAEKDEKLLVFYVDKIRDLYDVDGCIVEYATVKVEGRLFKTVAAELPDPEKVKQTVRKMGLWGKENINYVKALKRIRMGQL